MEDQNKQLVNDNMQTSSASNTGSSNRLGRLAHIPIKIVLIAAGVLASVVLLAIFGVLVIKKDNLKPKATNLPPKVEMPENVLLATVGDVKIMRDDVVKLALEQYASDAITSDILKMSIESAIERIILDREAKVLNIKIAENSNKALYYEDLKNQISLRKIGTVTANSIAFWVPAFSDIYPQKPEYQEMRDLQPDVFEKAVSQLKNGMTTYEVGTNIIKEYPVFKEQLSVNSYKLSKVEDESLFMKPVIYQYIVNDSNKIFLDFVFSLKNGDIDTLVWPDGEGAAIVQVVDKSTGEKISYDDWLFEQKKSVVYESANVNKL